MYAVAVFAKRPQYQLELFEFEKPPIHVDAYTDSASVILDSGVVDLSPGDGEVFLLQRYSVGARTLLTWIGLYRPLDRPKFPQRGGLFYGVGLWMVPQAGQGARIVQLLSDMADRLERLIPEDRDEGWNVRELRQGVVDEMAADWIELTNAPPSSAGGAPGTRHDKYGAAYFLDLSHSDSVSAILDEALGGGVLGRYSRLYMSADINVVAAARRGKVPVGIPAKVPMPADSGAAMDVAAHPANGANMQLPPFPTNYPSLSELREFVTEVAQTTAREEVSLALRAQGGPARPVAASAPRRRRFGGMSIFVPAVALVGMILYGVQVFLKPLQRSPSGVSESVLNAQMPKDYGRSGSNAGEGGSPVRAPAAPGPASGLPETAAAPSGKTRQERQRELAIRVEGMKARLQTMEMVIRDTSWATRDNGLKSVEAGVADLEIYLGQMRDLTRELRSDLTHPP